MADRPILLSAPMVRAILAGTKTQTRRALTRQNVEVLGSSWRGKSAPWEGLRFSEGKTRAHSPANLFVPFCHPDDKPTPSEECGIYRVGPTIEVGDRLWVRETYSGEWVWRGIPPREWAMDQAIWYWADGDPEDGDWTKPKPGIHMPRWASRISLEVTGVRVERLQDISEDDAEAEGLELVRVPPGTCWKAYGSTPAHSPGGAALGVLTHGRGLVTADPRHAYATLWDSINGPGSWDANPWVAAYTFQPTPAPRGERDG